MHQQIFVRHGFARALLVAVCVCSCACQPTDQKPDAAKADAKANPESPEGESPEVDDSLPSAERLLADTAKVLGGEQLANIKGVYTESAIDMKSMGLKGTAKAWWQGNKFYGDSEIPGVGLTRIGGILGQTLWSDDPIHGLRSLSGREAEQAAWGSSVCLPCTWKDQFKAAKTRKITDDGKAVISLTTASGDEMVMTIDLESKLPLSQKFKQASPLGDTPIEIKFEDYREVSGMQVAHRQVVHASIMTITSEVTKVEVNPTIDPKIFEMPAPKGGIIDPANPAPAPSLADTTATVDPAKQQPAKPEPAPKQPVKKQPAKGSDALPEPIHTTPSM